MDLKLEEELGVIFCQWENYRFIFMAGDSDDYDMPYALDGSVKIISTEDCGSHIELTSEVIDQIADYKFQAINRELSVVTAGNFYIANSEKFSIQVLNLPHSGGLRTQFYDILKRINCFVKFVHENKINLIGCEGRNLDSIYSIKENKLDLLNKLAEEHTDITLICGKIRAYGNLSKQKVSTESGSETWEEFCLGAGEEDSIVEINAGEITESTIINIYQYYDEWKVEIYP